MSALRRRHKASVHSVPFLITNALHLRNCTTRLAGTAASPD
jgi:hypothetical protein